MHPDKLHGLFKSSSMHPDKPHGLSESSTMHSDKLQDYSDHLSCTPASFFFVLLYQRDGALATLVRLFCEHVAAFSG